MDVPGVDQRRLSAWMSANTPDLEAPERVSLISGGKSNLTYRLDTPGRALVLRRPPLGHVLPTAHDMRREWRVISALHGTAVPVPEPVAFCGDEDVLGAPFYLMAYVEGTAIVDEKDAGDLSPERTRELSTHLAEVLAAIHAVDYEAAGLGDLGRPEGYLARQLRRWGRQWERSKTADLPEYDRLARRLADRLESLPPGGAALVHGDYRLDNALVRGTRIAVVVDWEMSTLGDPLADLGLTVTYWQDPDDPGGVALARGITARPGFLTVPEFVAAYARASGQDLRDLDFYIAFGNFKLAVIAEGIHARHLGGKTVGEGFDRVGEAVPVLIARAHRVLDAASGGR
ncbi:phosphotransferase family protein [Bailinhaonella thermotolerans]|uniref:Phosphotransferase family protein n=1 Tax=Bailinhaonella thermotolerans TaxID=1070861 RepID=A0A3A4BEB8_9ACTN|nr:phosphotransferase family protein [Bailinhaonella thermotolerans]RJL32650.1 phosphotransferase family protein [Bailinhaonella thermotolerans]